MAKRDRQTVWDQELDDIRDRAAVRDARRNETLTRGEMLDAIEAVASKYSSSALIGDALRKLAEELL
jgi:hypothetical protein